MHPAPPGFHKAPFEPSADPALIFHHGSLEKARAEFMLSQISDRRGLFLVVGEPGAGKTTLLLSLRLQSGEEKPYAYLVCAEEESYAALVQSCCKALGVAVEAEDAESLKQALSAHLASRSEAGVATTLLIDAAENLTDDALRGLVEIAGFDVGKRRLLHIVVVARPEVEAALERTGLDRADEAIAFQCHLDALGQDEIEAYIEHRLKAAGYEGQPLFNEDALRRIGAASKGLPGQVSRICRAALEAMQENGRAAIGGDIATHAIERCGFSDEYQAAMLPDTAIQELWELAESIDGDDGPQTLEDAGEPDQHVVSARFLKSPEKYTPDAAPGQPVPASVQSGTTSKQLEVASELPEAALEQPEEAPVQPAAVSAEPEVAPEPSDPVSAHPEEASAQPEEASAQPEAVSAQPGKASDDAVPPQRRPWLVPFDWEANKETSESEFSEVLTAWRDTASDDGAANRRSLAATYWPAAAVVAAGVAMGTAFAVYQAPDELWAHLGITTPEEIEISEIPAPEPIQDPVVQAEPTGQDPIPPAEATARSEPENGPALEPTEPQVAESSSEPPPAPVADLDVLPVAAPRLTIAAAIGQEDQGIPLELEVAAAADGNPDIELSVELAGLPEGTVLSAGASRGSGAWVLNQDQLAGLKLLPPEHYSGEFMIEVTARAQSANGDSATKVDVLTVNVAGVADPPPLTVSDSAGREDEAVPLDIKAALTDRDGSERLLVFVADLPEGASLSAGEHEGKGNWSLTPDQLPGLELLPPEDFSGSFEINVGAMAQETDNENRQIITATATVTIAGVADTPQLVVSGASGREDQSIPLTIESVPTDQDGSEQLEILIAGLPEGARLSAGDSQGGGKWRLTREELTDLEFLPPGDFNGTLELTASAISREPDSDDQAITSIPLAVTVAAVADAPQLVVSDSSGSEDLPIPLEIRASLKEGIGSASLSILLSNLPEGARLSAGSDEGDGRWTLEPDQLANLKLTPPPSFSGAFEITAEAIAQEAGDNIAAAAKEDLKVTVTGVADKPRLVVKQARGLADKPIPLDITAALGDADGSEKLSIILSGLPEGAQLSAGKADANGVWRLTEKQLSNLELMPPPEFSGEFEITAGAISLEKDGNTARTIQPLKVTVVAPKPAPATENQAADNPPESAPQAAQQAARTPSDPRAEAHMGRGDELLALGDVAAARLFYELAFDLGQAGAATAIAKTYDPLHLRKLGVHGVATNKAKAIEWYKQALRAGDKTATIHLKALSQNQE